MALTIESKKIKDLLMELYKNIDSLNGPKEKLMLDKLNECIQYKNNLIDLDTELNQYFYSTKNNNEIISDTEIHDKLDEINDTSLIIYIKKAQIYKVYSQDNIDDFENDDNTIFRKPENGPVHEVVRDNKPQKLMIIVNDDIHDDQLDAIKTSIVNYIKINSAFKNTTNNDIKCYSNNNSTEFVLTNLSMENIREKDKLIEKFMLYLEKHGNHDLASKIQLRPKPSHLDGARLYKLPTSKISLDSTYTNTVSQLITTAAKSQAPVIINNTYIINNVNSNNVNSNNVNSTIKNNTNVPEKKSLKTFKNYLRDNKPVWYVEGEMVDMILIENAYKTYFNDNSAKTSVISRQLNGLVFNDSKRCNGITKKKLMILK